MRIERLDLTAFGPFTDLPLDLSEPGVHLVYGPNEAGKTSALAALRSLLYGIPHRTPFGFLHGMSNLKLGAVLSNDEGETLELVRHKRNKNPLTRPDGSPLPEGELLGFLNGVPQEVFTTVFALTLVELQQGGANLIHGKGDIGQALYSARSGQDTSAVLNALEDRRKELYLRTGSLPRLNAALAEHRKVVAERESASTLTEEYVRLEVAAREAQKRFSELDDRLAEREAEFRHWETLAAVLPSLRIRRQALAGGEEIIAQGPLAVPDTEERLNRWEKDLELSEQRCERSKVSLEKHRSELAELHVDDRLTNVREEVDSLVRSVEAIVEADQAWEEHTLRAREKRSHAEELLRRVRPDVEPGDSGIPRVAEQTTDHLVELAKEHPGLRSRVEDTLRQVQEHERALDNAQAALSALPENEVEDALGTVIAEYPFALVTELTRAYEEEAKAAARLDALVADPGPGPEVAVEDLLSATVPTKREIVEHRDRFTRYTAEAKSGRTARTKVERELNRARGELESLRAQEDPPTIDDLRLARRDRDDLWRRFREEKTDSALTLAFQDALVETDRLSDRLRDSAEAVAQRLTLEGEVRRLEQDLREREEDLDALASQGAELDRVWEALWPTTQVPAPALDTAESVLERLGELRELHEERSRRQRSLAVSEESALALSGQLVDLLTTAGVAVEPLDVRPRTGAVSVVVLPQLKALAEEELDRRQKADQDRTTALALVQDARKRWEEALHKRDRVQQEKDEWSLEWDRNATTAGFAPDSDPEEVRGGLALLDEAATAWEQARTAEAEADRTGRRIAEFDQRLAMVFDGCDRALPQDRAERTRALEELHRHVEENAATVEKHGALEQTIVLEESELFQARTERDAAREKLTTLLAETGSTTTGEVRAAISRSREAEQERERVRQAEEQLARHGEIDDLEEQVRHLTDTEIDERSKQAEQELSQVRLRRDQAHTDLTKAEEALARVDGTGEAAQLAEREVALADQITDQAEEYVKVTLARQILLERMEEYRKNHQDPILRKAQELFEFLTLREFPRLYPDLDDKGGNVLRVVRRNGQIVEISELSEGTADQLYLALRLASLEHYDEIEQTMPLVMDDVFMTFDDERSAAALRVLDQMADRFQVVVFTHHAHLTDLAVRALPSGRAHVHELPRYTPPARGKA